MSCYMCNDEATNDEHVPPKCLFPKAKDVDDGKDYRKELIKVKSCDLHNSIKSTDDEYLLYVLTMSITSNHVAKIQQQKLLRAISYRPSLIKSITKTAVSTSVMDEATGAMQPAPAFRLDEKRIYESLDHIVRGLFFHHFGRKWLHGVRIYPEFILSFEGDAGRRQNKIIRSISLATDLAFSNKEYFGENSDVFKYQVMDGTEGWSHVLRLHFYDGCKVICFLGGRD